MLQSTGARAFRPPFTTFPRAVGALIAFLTAFAPSLTETAVANGDTRTINLYHAHTQESISATYLVNGRYDPAVLEQLNWFLRDWRRDEPTKMDPRLFDVVWETYRSAGASGEPIHVVSAYRSPETNAMLRARSRAVAKYSQHMLGKAMDTTMPGMPMSRIREIGMRMQRGGVGYYPTAGTPFVHLDVGGVRAWPRMTYEQLARLFPDGKTVHLPSNGQPLARYEEAKAEIEARDNGAIVIEPRRSSGGFLAFLFGESNEDESEDAAPAAAPSGRKQWAELPPRGARGTKIAAAATDEEGGGESAPAGARSRTLAKAEANLPQGETVMTAAPEPAASRNAPLPPARPASLDGGAAPVGDEKKLSVAGVEGLPDAAPGIEENAPLPPRRPAGLDVVARAPLPPVRPLELALAGRESETAPAAQIAPTPPARPKSLGRGEEGRATVALANLMDPAGGAAPGALAPQPRAAKESGAEALAYAPSPVVRTESASAMSKVAQKPEFVAARLDPSNFRAMIDAAPTARAAVCSVLGSSISAVRSAARAAGAGLLAATHSETLATRFSARITAPAPDKFAAAQ